MPLPSRAILAVSACLIIQTATADGLLRDILSSGATTASTYLTVKDRKLVGSTEEDVVSFVASAGEIRGPHLEAVLRQLRSEHPELQAQDDLTLASAIMATATTAEPSHRTLNKRS
ncbi:DUF2388 domain-containing protein [Pseudomonas sp. NCCP-436]|uniref:DUF2388 domain-containing protein n=1 Tax=Pseudomonas sp. NCCP-436 TaxID=2842481 RepID=UPI001C7FE7DC|nr:DUF2388 domain-containing protein [Pseudomonas sp. NCCP-436]GIZ12446.1 hypothetical protein NCCP436_18620 [Pseudomonas sp. NCCP-436]